MLYKKENYENYSKNSRSNIGFRNYKLFIILYYFVRIPKKVAYANLITICF